ncbi:MAG TPA: hypothetical protein DCL21_02150, partial [Alphaproteobacteria bacterium]|nr:hypothetical protein [Alphaproteobacteria bacterium]
MLEYILQTIFLISVLFVYMLAGSVVYSAVGEGYKSTPLRCFAVGVGLWVLLVVFSTMFFKVSIEYLWFSYFGLTLLGLLNLPSKDQEETLDKRFFYQVLVSFCILLPVFIFLSQDKMHLWQEFAIYGKGLYSLLENKEVTNELLKAPLAYQLAVLPVGYFISIQNNIFACFNTAIFAFVACEFVRNSGVKMKNKGVSFPLVVAFALLVALNPFSIRELLLSADPFIFICAVGFAFAEYIFRPGHLPKNVAAIPPAIILMLLAFSSTQGFLLACSLFVVLLVRYLIQISSLNHKQLIGFAFIPLVPIFVMLLWQFYLNQKGLGFLLFDIDKVTFENIGLVYKALWVLAKHHYVELCYIAIILLAGVYSFLKVKKADDLIIDKYLLKSVFWVVLIYVFVCVPVFFTQYDYVARASYSLGFTSIALIQFIILMPIGRFIKEGLE